MNLGGWSRYRIFFADYYESSMGWNCMGGKQEKGERRGTCAKQVHEARTLHSE